MAVINILLGTIIAKMAAFQNSHFFQLGLNICQTTQELKGQLVYRAFNYDYYGYDRVSDFVTPLVCTQTACFDLVQPPQNVLCTRVETPKGGALLLSPLSYQVHRILEHFFSCSFFLTVLEEMKT